jgi:hypothetical protein
LEITIQELESLEFIVYSIDDSEARFSCDNYNTLIDTSMPGSIYIALYSLVIPLPALLPHQLSPGSLPPKPIQPTTMVPWFLIKMTAWSVGST